MKKKSRLEPSRLSLRGWAALEDLRRSIDSAAEEGEWSVVPELIFQSIELCCEVDRDSDWMEVAATYNQILQLNLPTKKFPMLTSKDKGKPMPWEYPGRSWYFWLNVLAKSYGWSAEEIGEMDVDDAIGLYQEIVIDDQLENEWQWGLSEMSYEYNNSTKKSHFKPLPRPDWMKGVVGKPKPVPKIKMPVRMMPVGNIFNLDEPPSSTVQ
jgi:hypothetical protein